MSPRIRQWTRVILVSFALTVLVTLIIGMSYEAIAGAAEARRVSKIGTRYDIGSGVKLNLFCAGAAGPTVIFESGIGSPGYSWFRVQPEVSKFARACWYDRGGYGWSDPSPNPRTSDVIARELHALLTAAGVPPPYVFVAHSFGGFTARVYHAAYPSEVAGIVLVDSSHPDQMSRMTAPARREWERELKRVRYLPFLINIGMVRLLRHFNRLPVGPSDAPPKDHAVLEYLWYQPKLFRATYSEMRNWDTSAGQARDSGDLGSLPLEVLVATEPEVGDDSAWVRAWNEELQPSLARLSSRGRITLLNCHHMIQYERPDAVIDATRRVVEAVRSDRLLCLRLPFR